MPSIRVTDAVLNNGTLVREGQLLNMPAIVVAAAVLNKGTVTRFGQSLKNPVKFVTD